jgi:stage II sporulation protein D
MTDSKTMPAAYPIASARLRRHAGGAAARRASRAAGRLALVIAGAILFHACAKARPPSTAVAGARPAPGAHVKVKVRVDERGGGLRVRSLALEDYVAGCVDAEMGRLDIDAASAARIRRVQAVLCRTFAVANLGRHASEGFDLCSTTHCQLYRHLPAESLTARLAQQAAADTAALVVTFNGKPIQALYHANCGGRTSPADAVWGGRPEPYLTSVSDPACAASAKWRSAIERERLRQALHADPRTDPGSRLDGLAVAARDEAGRATSITIAGTQTRTTRGETFRAVVTQALGAHVLRSTWFSVRREGSEFVFEGRGSGHGAGLCQAGALAQATAGRSDAAILAFYFPGTKLLRLTDSP